MSNVLRGSTSTTNGLRTPVLDNGDVQSLCECLERIFLKGLNVQGRSLANLMTLRCPADDCWRWLKAIGASRSSRCQGGSSVPYSYSSSIEKTERNSRLKTNGGRLRYFLRTSLVRRCTHIPIQLLRDSPNWPDVYSKHSILGDDILLELTLSVLMSLSKFEFNLNLNNCLFLDETWDLPECLTLQLVPSRILGVTLVFIQSKAVVVNVMESSVAEESGQIKVGDILVSVNDMEIDEGTQGSMMNVMRKTAGRPLDIVLIKSVRSDNTLFPPMTRLLKQAGISGTAVVEQYNSNTQVNNDTESSIFYVGQVSTCGKGDVKQIFTAINQLVDGHPVLSVAMNPVTVECHDMGVRVISEQGTILFEHAYMEISSCGSSKTGPLYFAYIAGDGNFSSCKNFQCYVFHSKNRLQVESLLKTIGQGFKRTLFTV